MQRYTKKDAVKAFELLCGYLGKRLATTWNDVGGWQLDHNAVYGGYVVQEIVSKGGGISHPFGHSRRNAREFCDAVRFVRDALEVKGRK